MADEAAADADAADEPPAADEARPLCFAVLEAILKNFYLVAGDRLYSCCMNVTKLRLIEEWLESVAQ